MFRIGILELALTCGLILLAIIIPIIVARFSRRLDRRLKNIENLLEKKK
jgi:flagellar biosynthesis protein FliR